MLKNMAVEVDKIFERAEFPDSISQNFSDDKDARRSIEFAVAKSLDEIMYANRLKQVPSAAQSRRNVFSVRLLLQFSRL